MKNTPFVRVVLVIGSLFLVPACGSELPNAPEARSMSVANGSMAKDVASPQAVLNLTTDVDALTGTSGDDWFSATAGTYSFDDQLAGGSGNDRLLFSGGAVGTIGENVTSIEYIALEEDGELYELTLLATAPNLTGSVYGDASTLELYAENYPHDLEVYSGEGNDFVHCGSGSDYVFTHGGVDAVVGGEGADIVNLGPGNDSSNGNGGDDGLSGDWGNDVLIAGPGNDQMSGGPGDDYLFGNDDDDTIWGNSENDHIDGGDGTDTLDGGLGDDRIIASPGNDTMTGGWGYDVFVIPSLGLTDTDMTITDMAIEDKIDVTDVPGLVYLKDLKAMSEGTGTVIYMSPTWRIHLWNVQVADIRLGSFIGLIANPNIDRREKIKKWWFEYLENLPWEFKPGRAGL